MEIVKLKLSNFLAIGEAEIVLDNKGLVLIQGENLDDPSADSNGAGKSSIVDALCWALYGVTARGVTGNDVINDTVGKNCRVSVSIHDEGDYYTITRHRKHKEGKNSLQVMYSEDAHGTADDLSKGTDKLTQQMVNKIMGCSVDVFTAAVYAGQDAMPDLPGMTDKFLKQLVEEAAGIDRLQAAHVIAKTRQRDAADIQKDALGKVELITHSMTQQKEFIESAEGDMSEWDKEQQENMLIKKEAAKGHLTKARTLKKALEALDAPGVKARLAELKVSLDGHETENQKLSKLSEQLTNEKMSLSSKKTLYRTELNAIQLAKASLSDINARIGTDCEECGKSVTEDDLQDVKRMTLNRLNAIISSAKAYKADMSAATECVIKARDALKAYETSMTDVSAVASEQARLMKTLDAVKSKSDEVQREKGQAKHLLDAVNTMNAEINPHIKTIKTHKEKYTLLEKRLKNAKERALVVEEQVLVAKDVVDVFGPAGVRAHILDTVTPFLNDRTAHYLGALSDGSINATWNTLSVTAKGEIREKFSIEVINDKGGKNFASLSGGEKRKVRLATAMALQDLVASRAMKPINLFVADEVDHALDSAGLERLMSVLDEKARDRGTVLVISHNELTDWIRETTYVTRKDGLAGVTGVLAV